MELMSSSEDEGDEPTRPSPARSRPAPAAASQDSLEDELLSPRARGRSSAEPPTGHKRVISARELLLNFLPSARQRKQPAKTAQDAAADAAVAAYALVTPKKATPPAARRAEERGERELTAGERIARKYGLVAAARASSKQTPSRERGASSSRPSAASPSHRLEFGGGTTSKKDTASPAETPVEKTKKRSFWDAQTVGVDTTEPAQKATYVSPFSDPDGFTNMKKRRQRQQRQQEMSKEEMKSARDAFYDDSKSEAQIIVGRRPRHVIGSAIPAVDDADEWMSDSKEMVSDDDMDTEKVDTVANAEALPSTRRAKATTSRPTARVKQPHPKRPARKRVLKECSDSSEDEKVAYTSERWPQLNPPQVRSPNFYSLFILRLSVEFLYSAYQRDTGAILGDDMGLGKTIQVIAFLSAVMGKYGDHRDKDAWIALLHQRRERFSNTSGGHPEEIGFSFAGEIAPIVIVMPASLLQNWEHELHTWMSCSTIILRGKPSDRDAMIDQIASYDILKMYLSRLHKIPWEMVILDEMHCLKNPEAQLTKAVKAVKCKRKLGLTGTLMQNNEKELHCLVDTIVPGAIGSWADFSMYYGNDIKYGRKKSAAPEAVRRSHQKEKELRKKLRPYYLRREKEINPTFQVLKKSDQVVFCDLTPLQMAAYERVLAMPEFELLRRGEEPCDCGRDSKEKRKKCCYKTPADLGDAPGLLYERFHEDGPCKNCPNCMGLPCVAMLLKLSNHLELLKVNPHDRSELQHYQADFAKTAFGGDLNAVGGVDQVSSFQEMCAISTKTCGKMIVLEKLLAVWKKRKERTLIFSRSTRMLDIIQLFLITKATRYSRLDGNTKVEERLQMVNDFNSPDSNTTVFLISTRAGGVGLNLQSATNVVIFDPSWNPAHDCQAQDRAYRIGQTKDVQVYRLITLGTIEEMIYVRQIYKQQLIDTTLKGANAPRYFEGVQGNPQQRGELFGIANLICWKPGGVLKGIQDAYQRSRDGLIVQQTRVRYDSVPTRKMTKKEAPKKQDHVLDDDEGEMIEVADELVSDMLTPGVPPTSSPSEENPVNESGDSGDDDMGALLNGATTFRHEEIVGEQEDEHETYQMEENTAGIDDESSDRDLAVETLAQSDSGKQASPSQLKPGKKSPDNILSRMKDMKSSDGEQISDRSGKKRVYVPTYL
ncbi:unnamed protein product [Phytophthora fragariaefolia]|uniref:Unnamed protein product n=1 Tax=Phytophthora fragariaefolia TaxID=1490495 RepID=A0A9W6XTW8_9STRA|nr:unnamed protein product [Phytophthora fragariaefolia]